MLLQAAVNGNLTKAIHPAVPITIEELAQDAVDCVAAGARMIHLHPRDADGRERLDAEIVDAVVAKVRTACGVPVGVSTGAWIEPDAARRASLVRAWREPDYASVNLSEAGAEEVMGACEGAGVGIEAGVWTVEDVERLAASGYSDRVVRALIEPRADAGAGGRAADIRAALFRHEIVAPRLQHGDGDSAWAVLADAVDRGLHTRIGLEDTQRDPSGERTAGNAALVRAARWLMTGDLR